MSPRNVSNNSGIKEGLNCKNHKYILYYYDCEFIQDDAWHIATASSLVHCFWLCMIKQNSSLAVCYRHANLESSSNQLWTQQCFWVFPTLFVFHIVITWLSRPRNSVNSDNSVNSNINNLVKMTSTVVFCLYYFCNTGVFYLSMHTTYNYCMSCRLYTWVCISFCNRIVFWIKLWCYTISTYSAFGKPCQIKNLTALF